VRAEGERSAARKQLIFAWGKPMLAREVGRAGTLDR